MKHVIKTIMLILLTASSASLAAAVGYSVNSDSPTANHDSLYRIDLDTGQQTRLGFVRSQGQIRLDVEGLAFAPDGTLYGMDDESMKLFPLSLDDGQIISNQEVSLSGLPTAGGNDFGMSFACDGTLYVTSASDDSLYKVALDGTATRVGDLNSLGTDISALAAWGNPVELYGLGKGGLNSADTARLYSINPANGIPTPVGFLGAAAAKYDQAGLSFDNTGQLWAITDRSQLVSPLPSQILQIDKTTGVATLKASTAETGFESLAITLPRGCGGGGDEQRATFTVQSRFVDSNNITPVTLHLDCNTGQILDQSKTVLPNEGVNGKFEVSFVVTSLGTTPLNCTVTQDAPFGYTPSYTCLGVSECVAPQSADNCSFTNVIPGSDNLCTIQSTPNAVPFTVKKVWLFEAEEIGGTDYANIYLHCDNVFDGDGLADGKSMTWNWTVSGNAQRVANIQPSFKGISHCRATESNAYSAVEAENGCESWIPVLIGDSSRSCTITNTVFLEGIPTLSDYGRLLLVLLMLGVGLVAIRRV